MTWRTYLAAGLIGFACRMLQPEQPWSLIATASLIGVMHLVIAEARR